MVRLTQAILVLLSFPVLGMAAVEPIPTLPVAPWSIAPFMLMLLGIALLPLFAGHFWHGNLRKLCVALGLSLPVVIYLATMDHGLVKLEHALIEYIEFIILLASLYTVAGGIVLEGSVKPTPMVNLLFLAGGAVLANFIGTTGASMLLIRPMLRINATRSKNKHIPIFFIFIVSNLGGLLTPLGDPPLFLGFLHGVDFFWTLKLAPHWAVGVGVVLAIFLACDAWAYRSEPQDVTTDAPASATPIRLRGAINFLFLAGILIAVVLQSKQIAGPTLHLEKPFGPAAMVLMAVLSWVLTPKELRRANDFTWEAILEVAVLFIGIFITMVPALELLKLHGDLLGVKEPWQYFWLTGGLSSFLDNAPTYLTFSIMAAGSDDLRILVANEPLILAAISAGAVFMGANTYIGNGPNFMVKAIAESAGYRMPSFFGYMIYSGLILIPTFVLISFLFF